MNYETQGKIHRIGQTTEYGSNGFTKREFVLLLTGEGENPKYPNYVSMELVKDKCSLMDQYQPGDTIRVSFNLTGRLWTPPGKPERCFNSLQAWKITPVQETHSTPQFQGDEDWENEEIPF